MGGLCVERSKAEETENWKEKANNGDQWNKVQTKIAYSRVTTTPASDPYKVETRGRTKINVNSLCIILLKMCRSWNENIARVAIDAADKQLAR